MTEYIGSMKRVIAAEAEAVRQLENICDGRYEDAFNTLLSCRGKVVFMGVGKSGHIGEKLAATFSSTGTPAFFVHSTEACHGDLGMIGRDDVAVLISNSGSTKEVLQDLEGLDRIGCETIAFTSDPESPLAKGCKHVIVYPKLPEADALNLAPTVSSTLTLVLGDAFACALSEAKGFTREDFHKYHPNGALGAMLQAENGEEK